MLTIKIRGYNNNNNKAAMSSVLHVIFKPGTPGEVVARELMKHEPTEAKVFNANLDGEPKGYFIVVPDNIVFQTSLQDEHVLAVSGQEDEVTPQGSQLIWPPQEY